MNIIEKCLAQKANLDTVIPGDRVVLEPNCLIISGKSALNVIKEFYELRYQKVHHPPRTVFIFASDVNSGQLAEMKHFCDINNIDLVNKLEGSVVEYLLDKQINLNELVVAGVEGHIGTLGVYGTVSLIVSPAAMARCLGTGKIEMVIPETVYIEINGKLKKDLNAESICDFLKDYFNDSLVGCGIIIGGSTVELLDEKEQRRITRFFIESGGAFGIISPVGPLGQVESAMKIRAQQIK